MKKFLSDHHRRLRPVPGRSRRRRREALGRRRATSASSAATSPSSRPRRRRPRSSNRQARRRRRSSLPACRSGSGLWPGSPSAPASLSLFFNNGIGGALAGMLMIGLLVAAAIFAVRYFMRGRTAPQAAAAVRGRGHGRAGADARRAARRRRRAIRGRHHWAARALRQAQWPAGFDAAAFARHAKVNFVQHAGRRTTSAISRPCAIS